MNLDAEKKANKQVCKDKGKCPCGSLIGIIGSLIGINKFGELTKHIQKIHPTCEERKQRKRFPETHSTNPSNVI